MRIASWSLGYRNGSSLAPWPLAADLVQFLPLAILDRSKRFRDRHEGPTPLQETWGGQRAPERTRVTVDPRRVVGQGEEGRDLPEPALPDEAGGSAPAAGNAGRTDLCGALPRPLVASCHPREAGLCMTSRSHIWPSSAHRDRLPTSHAVSGDWGWDESLPSNELSRAAPVSYEPRAMIAKPL